MRLDPPALLCAELGEQRSGSAKRAGTGPENNLHSGVRDDDDVVERSTSDAPDQRQQMLAIPVEGCSGHADLASFAVRSTPSPRCGRPADGRTLATEVDMDGSFESWL